LPYPYCRRTSSETLRRHESDALRHIHVGALTVEGVVTLEILQANPALLSSFPSVQLTDELTKRFLNGQRLALGKEDVAVPAELGMVRVYHNENLLGTAILQEYAVLAPERLIAFKG
jgi:tRNA pseudouridine55 synthase